MAETSTTGTCPRCAAPITIQPGAGIPKCPYCGTLSTGSIEAERAVLGHIDNRFQRKQMREELLRRKEVLGANLDTIDPLAKWIGGEPVWMGRKAALRTGVVYLVAFFFMAAGEGGRAFGILTVVCTTLFVLSMTVSYSGRCRQFSAARAKSTSNHQTIQKLQADLRETDDLLRQLDDQGEAR